MIRIYLHPLPLRVWHWINAWIVILLALTGLYLRRYGIAALQPHDSVLLWHKCLGLAMIVTVVFWFIYNMSNKNRRQHYSITRRDIQGIFAQARFYLFSIFAGEENPFQASGDDKYNPLQKIAYDAIMFIFLPIQAITGLLFMDIPLLRYYLLSGNLIGFLGAIHVLFAYLLVLFFIVHLYMTTFGDTVFSHTKAMITGYEEKGQERKEDRADRICE